MQSQTDVGTVLNAEWNKPKDRAVNLHRHPAFFGSVDDVIGDCCGSCPLPLTIEEEEVSEKESKMYMAGKVTFMKDDCGRQAIGSFNPLSPDEYTDMAYVGNTELLCQAIIDRDIHYIEQWLRQDGNNANTRDHTGRCPLHLAVAHSSLEVVQCLIDNGARLIPRMVDGKTALHLACLRGDPSIVSALLRKSESNEEDEMKKSDGRRRLRVAAKNVQAATASTQASTFEVIDTPDSEMDIDAMTEGSMVLVKDSEIEADGRLDQDDNNSPDVYDVNVLTWDTHTSPLHLAILSGHGAVVECLVQDFGANILMPVAPPTPGRHAIGSSKDTRLVLTLAFTLPFNEAKDMTCLLFKLGASSAQADSNQKTALEYCVFDQPDLLETYIISDPVGVARAIKHISMQYSWYASGPLQAAISNRDLDTALRLLRAGARPDVPFEAYIKGVETTANRSQFESHVDQPVVLAIRNEMPLLSGMLIEQYGINPNTLTAEGWRCVHNTGYPNSNGRSLLNLVNDKIKTLREWKHEARKCEPPKTLEEDSIYLSGLSEDTYKYWSAVKQIEDAKRRYKGAWDIHMAHLRTIASDEMGVEEKQAAIYDMLDQFRSLETILHAKSAKKFEELHPDINQVENLYHGGNGCNFGHYTYRTSMDEPFKLAFEFSVAIPNEEVRARYINLFESAWKGDVKTIKQLTMVPWTDINGEKRPPLQIAVQDHQNHSPLSIAVFSGNLDLATTIMAIAAAQYTPPDPPKAQRYHIATNSESEEGPHDIEGDDGASTDIPITSEVVDDNLTIENIGETSLSVKSNVKPEQMLHWEIPETKIAGHANTPTDLTELALARLDTQLLSFLLDQFEQYKDQAEATTAKDASMNKRNRLYQQPDLSWALVFGQPHMLAELIKRTAIGLSLDELALEHGANDTTVKSKYYQGLSVHGKKRKDWAAAGRNTSGLEAHPTQVPPLLVAVYRGTLEQVEWMLSDAPLRCYKHFAQAHQDDRRLQKISASAGGFEIVLKEFLNSRSRLAIHCCLARKEQDKESLDILKYLVEALPEAVEAKSANQCTPLLRAFQSQNLEAARILINAGADQTARDKDGMSMLHQLVACIPLHADDATNMRSMIDLIDKRLLTTLCLQRTSVEPGALTPLALWIERLDGSRKYQSDVTRLLLECSDGSELEAFNGEGLTVLHTLARMDSNPHIHSARPLDLAKIIVERHPALATWESATGKLPVELIEDILFAQRCSAINHAGNYQRRSRNQNAITERSPHEFINRKRVPHDNSIFGHDYNPDSKPELVMELKRHLLISTQAKLDAEGRGRRKLVALHDASEVARRLAGMQRKKLEAEDEKAAGKVDGWPLTFDQVERWLEGSRRAVSVKKWRW
jgi:ankyrin repeat protein